MTNSDATSDEEAHSDSRTMKLLTILGIGFAVLYFFLQYIKTTIESKPVKRRDSQTAPRQPIKAKEEGGYSIESDDIPTYQIEEGEEVQTDKGTKIKRENNLIRITQ